MAGNLGNLYNTQYTQGMGTLGQQANLAQQQNANTAALAGNLGNLYNTQYTQGMNSLGQQANLAQQRLANTQGNNSQNSALYGNLANMAGSRIALAAAAQEAAQNPAFRAWRRLPRWASRRRSRWRRTGDWGWALWELFPAGHKGEDGRWYGKEH